jgi:hypothetical protein
MFYLQGDGLQGMPEAADTDTEEGQEPEVHL